LGRSTDNDVDRMRHDARVAGLRNFETPSLEAVERRRTQLWVRTAMGLIGVAAGLVIISRWPNEQLLVITAPTMRTAFLVIAGGFFVAAGLQEAHLGRLARALTDERVLTAALTNRLQEIELLLDAGREMSAILELPVLLDTILRSATDLLDAGGGSVMLMDKGELEVAKVQGRDEVLGSRVKLGEGVAGHVAMRREPIVIDGWADQELFPGLTEREPYVEHSMSVPLIDRGELYGVLNVNGPDGRPFTQHDLRALAVFAAQAAAAIANAQVYEAQRSQVAELRDRRARREAG